MGGCTCVDGDISGVLLISVVVLGSSYLKRLCAALVVTGATKFGPPDSIFPLGSSSNGCKP